MLGGNVKVLVVEDEPSYREALASGLRLEGFDVEVATDGYEALNLLEKVHPDIVLLDMLLPGMHGIEVCRRMRAISQVPIVMVSAVDTELDVVLGLELGAAGYVTKPFRLRELVARMQAILRRVSPPSDPLTTLEPPPDDEDWPGPGRDEPPPEAAFGSVNVDFLRREVTVEGRQTHLSRREFDLLAVLLSPARRRADARRAHRSALAGSLPVGLSHPRHPHPPAPVQTRAGPDRARVHRHGARRRLPARSRGQSLHRLSRALGSSGARVSDRAPTSQPKRPFT